MPFNFTSIFSLRTDFCLEGGYFVLFCPKQSVASGISASLTSFSVDTEAVVAVARSS